VRIELQATRAAQRVRRRRHVRQGLLAALACLLPLGGLSGACCWGYFALLDAPALSLTAVETTGLHRLGREEVLAAAGVSAGAPVAALDLHRLERRLTRLAWVAEARARLRWPLRLELAVREKRPVALIQLDNLYYLDENAWLIKRLSPREGMDYPVITGVAPSDFNRSQKWLCSRVLPLLAQAAPEAGSAVSAVGEISEVHVDARGRLVLYTTDGVLLSLGERDGRSALREAGRLLGELRRRGLAAQVAAVDATCPARLFVRFRGQAPQGPEAAGSEARGA
jgi:cell division protein FtsQ